MNTTPNSSWRGFAYIVITLVGTLCEQCANQGHLTANAAAVHITALVVAGLLMVIDLIFCHKTVLGRLASTGLGRDLETLLEQKLAAGLAPVLARLETLVAPAPGNSVMPSGDSTTPPAL